MNNGSPFNQRGGFSPIPRMNNCGGAFRTPSPRQQPFGNGNFSSSRSPNLQQQSFPSPLYNSSPYSAHHNAQQKQRFCSPNAEQHSMYDNRSFNSSQSPNSFRSDRSFDGSFTTPHSQNSNRVNHLSGERICDKNSSFSPHTRRSCETSPSNVDFVSPKLPQHGNNMAVPTNGFRGTKRSHDGTSSECSVQSRSSDKWGKTSNFKSNMKSSCNNSHNSFDGMGRRLFRSPPSGNCNPGHTSDIDQYIDSSMLEDPWKELMEKLEEKERLEEKVLSST